VKADDMERVLAVSGDFYGAAIGEVAWTVALRRLEALVGAHAGAILLRPRLQIAAPVVFASTMPPPRAATHLGLEPFTSDELMPASELRRTAFWADFMREHDLGRHVGLALPIDAGWMGAVGLQRGTCSEPWNDDELALVRAVAPHLRRALRIQTTLLPHVEGSARTRSPDSGGARSAEPGAHGPLSPSLSRVAALVVAGLPDRRIADLTGLSHASVRTYVRRIFERLGVRSRGELVSLVLADRRREQS
jgi:DNA-binding CsgD family transcriptional regulator